MRQQQFLKVLTEAEANAKFDAAFATLPIRQERVALDDALGRVLAEDVTAPVDVPAFDRSNMDGFAVRAADTFGASEGEPLTLTQLPGARAAGPVAAAERDREIGVGEVLAIATGGAIPRGADAVCMVEHTEAHPEREGAILLERSVTPGENISATGSDLARGEVVCRRGVTLTSRETGLIAAVGVPEVLCLRKPRVAVLSTGNEVQAPGRPLALGQVYDSNRRIVSDAVREAGGEPIALPTLPDEEEAVRARLTELVTGEDPVDLIVLSGGTSKGQGDLNHRVISALARELVSEGDGPKGMLVHGVALKPGKPLCLAMVNGRPVVVLPGFPTSAIFTFQTFVVPRLRRLSGLGAAHHSTLEAAAAVSIPGAAGRTRYALVTVVEGESGPVVYPLGAGSGSVRTFSRA
ncbi:MAG: molybdopterin-binding protein, partial [Planctomycetota bacterium]